MTTVTGWRLRADPLVAGGLTLLVLAAGLLWSITHLPQRSWPGEPQVAMTLDGERYRVPLPEVRWLETFSALHFGEGAEVARAIVQAEAAALLDQAFEQAHARVTEVADWYYSLGGEYSRLLMTGLSHVGVVEPGHAARKTAELLFPENAWAGTLQRLEVRAAARLNAHRIQVREGWLAEVKQRWSERREPPRLPGAESRAVDEIALDELAQAMVARERDALHSRMAFSALAAGGAAVGTVVWRGAARAGRVASMRLAGRGAARVGSAAAGGAAWCAPAGPGALGCAFLAGAAVWIGTDWALLRADEHLHRDELVEALEAGLRELRDEVERDLLDGYDRIIAAQYDIAHDEIRDTFVPVRATAAGAGSVTQPASSHPTSHR